MKRTSIFRAALASSFADPKDVAAFKKCKANGHSDNFCFNYGDNGIGLWGHNTAQEHTPMVALPPDDMIARFGTINEARGKKVVVRRLGKEVIAIVGDRMPWKKNIKNGAGIDLNPATSKALGLKPPHKVPVQWAWLEE